MAFIGTPLDTRNTFQSLVGKRFNGDGSTTAFTLDVAPSSVLDIEVFVGNVRQDPNSAYTLSGTTLTFTGAPPSGTNNIYVVHQAKSVGTIDVPAGGVQAGSLATGLLTGQTDIGGAIADADLFLVDDGAGGTLRKTAASRIKTYAGFDVSSITGATALAEEPASTDELVISDGGTLKRLDFAHIFCKPSFHVHASGNLNLSDNTLTKINFPSEDYDADSTYDNSSNFRFTPGVAGKYHLYFKVVLETGANNNNLEFLEGHIYKNGSTISKMMTDFRDDKDGRTMTVLGSSVVESDADDYFEIYALVNHDAGQGLAAGGSHETFFGGYRLVGA